MKERKLDSIIQINSLFNIVYHTLPVGYVFGGEQHDFWEMSYVDKGHLAVRVEQEEILLGPGDFILYNPNVFHSCWTHGDENVCVLTLAFDAGETKELPFQRRRLRLGNDEKRCLQIIIREATSTYARFKNAVGINMDYVERPPLGSEHIIKNRIEELFVYLYRFNNFSSPSPDSKTKLTRNRDLAIQVQEFIDKNYAQKLTLESIAKNHNISVTHMKRIFKEQTGTTILNYLTDVRIREAKRLIQEGKLNFSQIAQEVGYDGIFYFSDVFKRKTGMTPTEYSKSQH